MTIRRNNRRLILRSLYRGEARTRAELSRWTGLTRPAVSDVIANLIDEGLVDEVGHQSGSPGKRPTLLEMPPDARSVAGIQVETDRIIGALSNLRGQVSSRLVRHLDSREAEKVAAVTNQMLDRLLSSATSPVLGIGVASPGLIDPDEGVVKYAFNLGWRDVPLRHMIQEHQRPPVHVANDTDCAGLAELLFGAADDHRSICTVVIETGVGAGFILDGDPYVGVSGGAGEIGHLRFETPARFGFEGNQASLEEIIGLPGISLRLRIAANEHPDSGVAQLLERELDLTALKELAEQEDMSACQVIKDTGIYLGKGLAALVNVLNPGMVIINGPVSVLGDLLLDSIWSQVKIEALPDFTRDLKLVQSSLGDAAVILGAVALTLRHELGLI